MDWSAMALMAITLVLVIIALTLCPSWFMAIPVLIAMITFSWDRRRRRRLTENQGLSFPTPPGADDAQPTAGNAPASAPAGDAQPRADDAQPTGGNAPASDPAGDALPRADDARPSLPDPAGDGPPRAGDASAPALAVVAAGKKRRKPESSSTLSPSSRIGCDVFLSFRGTDTRTTITDPLYNRLVGIGISVFKDDEEHPEQEELPPKLNEAIERSRIYIAILSIDYASSERCLWELVQMSKCKDLNRRTILIFYDVSPSDVKHQAGEFGRAFDLHEREVGSDTIEKWKEALRIIGELGELRGYSGKLYKGYEGRLIQDVAVDVARRLRDDDLVAADKLVGIDLHVQEVMRKLGVAYSEGRATELRGEGVRIVGICGVPGVGKTTLAKVVYNKMHYLFSASTFLPDISSKGVEFSKLMKRLDLQPPELSYEGEFSYEWIRERERLLHDWNYDQKFLIVLDNVDEREQIKELVGEPTWYPSGSRIIVTTNKREILSGFNVDDGGTVEDHEVEPMSYDHALELFRKHAFGRDPPEDVSEYDSLSIEIVKAIGGLPSVIVDHASYLRRNMNKDIWRSTLDSLQKHSEDRPAAFQVSYA